MARAVPRLWCTRSSNYQTANSHNAQRPTQMIQCNAKALRREARRGNTGVVLGGATFAGRDRRHVGCAVRTMIPVLV